VHEWFARTAPIVAGPDCINLVELWRETYSAGPDIKPSGFVTVVRVDRDAGTVTSE